MFIINQSKILVNRYKSIAVTVHQYGENEKILRVGK